MSWKKLFGSRGSSTKSPTNEPTSTPGVSSATESTDIPTISGIPELQELLENRDASEPIESFLEKWAPAYNGLNGPLGTICPNEWPILKELPAAIKAKASLVAVATYEVEGEKRQHAFIHCVDRTTYYVGSAPQFGSVATAHEPRRVWELEGKVVVGIVLGPWEKVPNAYIHLIDGTMWCSGDCRWGQLGTGTTESYRSEFKEVPNLRDVVALQSCSTACMVMDINRKVYGFGANDRGQMAASPIGGTYTTPHLIGGLNAIRPVMFATSFAHTVVVGENKVYSHGDNEVHQLGRETTGPSPIPSQITSIKASEIKKVVCGSAHTLCLMKSTLLLGWGHNKHGQLGLGHKDNVKDPVEINIVGKRVIDVLAMDLCSVFVTEDGAIYVCGRFDGKDITRPQKIKAENARDLVRKRNLAMTGGCARLNTNPLVLIDKLTLENKALMKQVHEVRQQNATLVGDLHDNKITLNDTQAAMKSRDKLVLELRNELQEAKQTIKSLQSAVDHMTSSTHDTAACMVQVALTPEEEHILVKNHKLLLTNMPSDEVKEHFYQERIINLHQLEDIEALATSKQKNEKLLKLILRHKDGYKALMETLDHPDFRETGIADQLRATDTSQFRHIRK